MPIDTSYNIAYNVANTADNSLNNIFALEQKLIADINDFNTKYLCFARKSHTNNNAAITNDINARCDKTISLHTITTAKNKVEDDITYIQDAITAYNITKGKTNKSNYNQKYKDLVDTSYNTLLDQRKDLDAKLAELYGTDDGITNYYVNQYRATMFSKIMLTILVTSLVYYTFMKMIKK
jgi:hypothetical protein